MIQLKPDCLIFQTQSGDQIPCSAELVTLELIGNAAEVLDEQLIRNASQAVLHYFKNELQREFVSVAEFAEALEKVLRGFGLDVRSSEQPAKARVGEADLRQIACGAGKGFELMFFASLREEVKRQVGHSPELLRFCGLRGCVKQLTGAQRWCHRCEKLSDQIVEYLRGCLSAETKNDCGLVVW